jgi:hypothetical protein
VKELTPYQQKIAEVLNGYGLGVLVELRLVEAWIRCLATESRPVPERPTIREIQPALRAIAKHPRVDSEVLARSYGL